MTKKLFEMIIYWIFCYWQLQAFAILQFEDLRHSIVRYSSPPFLKVGPLHLWRWLREEKIICHSRENLKSVLVILPVIQFNQNLKLVYYPSRAGPKNVKRAGPRSSFILNEPPKSSARPGSAHLSSSFSKLTPRPIQNPLTSLSTALRPRNISLW